MVRVVGNEGSGGGGGGGAEIIELELRHGWLRIGNEGISRAYFDFGCGIQ